VWRFCEGSSSVIAVAGPLGNAPLPCRKPRRNVRERGPARWPGKGENGGFEVALRYLHTMVRIGNIDESLAFFCNKLGMQEVRRVESEAGRYTLVFLAAPADKDKAAADRAPLLELTFNWDPEKYGEGRNFGHLAFEVDDIYAACDRLMKAGVTINRPPRDGRMAFVRSPDNISIELLQKGEAQAKKEPWSSMPNTGKW
jgi:lactoylglutathione lyase